MPFDSLVGYYHLHSLEILQKHRRLAFRRALWDGQKSENFGCGCFSRGVLAFNCQENGLTRALQKVAIFPITGVDN